MYSFKLSIAKKILIVMITIGIGSGSIVVPLSVHASILGGLQGDYSDDVEDNFQKGVVACAATAAILFLIEYIAGGFNVPTSDVPGTIKETILDCVLWAFKNALIQLITGQTVQWVQGGMAGNPAFVTNLREYLRTVADNVAGSYIERTVPFLCSPFRAQIQLQLVELYKERRGDNYFGSGGTASCTLTGSAENLQNFFNGDFYSGGGWDTWFEAYSKPTNNPYGAYVKTRADLIARIDSAQGEAEAKVSFGQGFLSKEVQNCYETTDTTEDGTVVTYQECDPPQIVTPGTEIKNSLEAALGVQLDQIAAADEFDEIVALWAVYIISDILSGDEGLAGYNKDDFTHEVPDVTLPDGGAGGPTEPNDSAPAGPPGDPTCYEANGTFLTPTEDKPSIGFNVTPEKGASYDSLQLEFDITNNGWDVGVPDGPVEAFWLSRPEPRDLFGYVKVLPPGQSTLTLRNGIGQIWGLKPKAHGKLPWVEGQTYHFSYVYDAKNQKVNISVFDKATGDRVVSVSSTPDVPGLNVGNEKFFLGFGYSKNEANPKERPKYGWEYADMKIKFISSKGTPSDCKAAGSDQGGGGPPADDDNGGGGGGNDDGPKNPLP